MGTNRRKGPNKEKKRERAQGQEGQGQGQGQGQRVETVEKVKIVSQDDRQGGVVDVVW